MNRHFGRRRFLAGVGGSLAFGLRPSPSLAYSSPDTLDAPQASQSQVCAERDEIYYDEHDLIVQRDCDGGDTAQREGMYWLGNWVRMNAPELLALGPTAESRRYGSPRKLTFTEVMDLLEGPGKTGRFRRHPAQTKLIGDPPFRGPMNDPKTTSRDQVLPLVAAMGVQQDSARLGRFHDRVKQDNYLLNKDVLVAFEEFIKRARNEALLLGGVIDKEVLDKSVDFRLDQAKQNGMDDVGDDLNLVVQLLLAAVRNGEQITAVRARYVKDRPKNYGVYLTAYRKAFPDDFSAGREAMIDEIEAGIAQHGWKPDCTSVLGVFKWYFRKETGGSSGIALLYKPILDVYFAGPIPT